MGRRRRFVLFLAVVALVTAACSPDPVDEASSTALGDNAITVGSFDFAESELLAEIYSQAMERGGFRVQRAFGLGSREFVVPALVGGLIEFVPEYAGTALRFLQLTDVAPPGSDADTTQAALHRTLRGRPLTVLEPTPAQNSNAFVVTRETADREGLRSLSDVARVASRLTFGGPPECPARPLCLAGLQRLYGLRFDEVITLDAGGPLTHQALEDGDVDMALLFTTDPRIDTGELVELADDRELQPPENVTPLVRTEIVTRWGPALVERIDAVSRRLTTDDLRGLNAKMAGGTSATSVAAGWLRTAGLS